MTQAAQKYPDVPDWFFQIYEEETIDLRDEPKWNLDRPIAIRAAITGAFFSRTNNPNQPYTGDEIAASAIEAVEAGATGVHIHVRNDSGVPVGKVDYYRRAIEPVREKFGDDVFIDGCTVFKTLEKAEEVLSTRLFETSPINTTACIVGNSVLAIPPRYQVAQTKLMDEFGVKPQIAVYTNGDIDTASRYIVKSALAKPPYYWAILPALPGCFPTPDGPTMVQNIAAAVQQIRDVCAGEETIIEICAAGRATSHLMALAMLLDVDSVRVGMEDTIYRHPHTDDLIESNAQAVRDATAIAHALGRKVATAKEFRARLQAPAPSLSNLSSLSSQTV